MVIHMIHPYWHKVVTTNHAPIMAALVEGSYYEVGSGGRAWPQDACEVVAEVNLEYPEN